MTHRPILLRRCRVFDGTRLRGPGAALVVRRSLRLLAAEEEAPGDAVQVDFGGDILSPGYVDLQVNGGDGVMFNDDPTPETLARIAAAHRRLGVTALLPTLITDGPETTGAAIAATIQAIGDGMPGIAGLHLEGPHLSVARKGAHDAALIRPMTKGDLDTLLAAAAALPVLKVTVAPENATEAQVRTLAGAGVLVSLGHTDADFDTCCRYFAAGARCVTHLFNAMSQLGNRAPGLVGAALESGTASAGLIADGIHVHPATMRAAWAAKTGPGQIFLVSDSMAVAGSDLHSFDLGGRIIERRDGRLTLADGTLAGADLDLTTAIRVLHQVAGVPLEEALQAATRAPANLIDLPLAAPGTTPVPAATLIRIAADLRKVTPLDALIDAYAYTPAEPLGRPA